MTAKDAAVEALPAGHARHGEQRARRWVAGFVDVQIDIDPSLGREVEQAHHLRRSPLPRECRPIRKWFQNYLESNKNATVFAESA